MSSARALSGVTRGPHGLIKPRERTACWQLWFCILFTWHGCSTTRHDKPSLSGRYQSAPMSMSIAPNERRPAKGSGRQRAKGHSPTPPSREQPAGPRNYCGRDDSDRRLYGLEGE